MVEAFDHVFENVCELDLIFHTDKVHHIVDEIVMGGMARCPPQFVTAAASSLIMFL
jgi:hypothetical protein